MTPTTPSPFAREWTLKECRAATATKTPAPHQKTALGRLHDWYASNADPKGGILALPTGGGKTFTAAHFLCGGPLSDGYKVLWLAHTHHLLEQAFHTFTAEMLGGVREPRASLKLRVVSGTPGHFPPRDIKPSDDVLIGTLQTITNAHRDGLSQLQAFIDSAKGKLFIVFDEAHHAPAPSYRTLVAALQEGGAPVLGLTATPTYSDEKKKGWLKKLFPQGILAQTKPGDLIAQGILAKPHFERAPTSVVPAFGDADYEKWIGTYRDIPEDVIDLLAKNADRNAFIAETYKNAKEKYGPTLIFSDRWFQCEAIVEALEKRGVKADAVYSHVDAKIASVEGRKKRGSDENAKALQRFRDGEIDVLVNVRMLTEGTDLPDAQTVFLTRQTTSQILLTQMVGRALRGERFGGTSDAYVVSFVDDWQQSIRWAEYDPLTAGPAGDEASPSLKRPPLQLISIDLIKRLARQMDSGTNVATAPFPSLMPAGWYHATYDRALPESDEIEARTELVMAFDDEHAGFEALIAALLKSIPEVFGAETVSLEAQRSTLDRWRQTYFAKAARSSNDLLFDILHVARHIAQGHGAPTFFPFSIRNDHDLDALARDFIARDVGPRSIHEGLRAEFERKDRFWRALFPRFEHLRAFYDGCAARLLAGPDTGGSHVAPIASEVPTEREPSEDLKAQVKRRDGHCLACGTTKNLTVDHVRSWYEGGTNDVDNLQTLCKVCNRLKAKRRVHFTTQRTTLAGLPNALDHFDPPHGDNAGDPDDWGRFLRRTVNLAAHVVDRILPNVPVRQWVLSLPYDLRRLLAYRPEVLRAVARIFAESIARRQRAAAKIRGAQSGAITFPQRFGGSLNLNVHMHVIVLDGVYAGTSDGPPTFHPTPPPTRAELELVARDVRDRVLRWLRKRGLVDPAEPPDEDDTDEPNALDACTQLAIAPGAFVRLDPRGQRIAPDGEDAIDKRPKDAANADGFDVHAAVRIRADDDVGREKLLRYCARPPFALDRIGVLADRKIAYRVKYARRGATHRVMTPTEFLARLAALIPPPKYPLVRYYGVLAPHAKWRRAIVPRPPHEADACGHDPRRADRGRAAAPTCKAIAARDSATIVVPTTDNVAPLVARVPEPGGQLSLFAPPPLAASRPPNILSDGHVRRLLGGQLLARAPRVPWATLMRRTFDVDVLACPRCGGRMRIVADIENPAVAAKILAHLGKPTRAPPIARARDPGDDDDEPAPPSSDDAT